MTLLRKSARALFHLVPAYNTTLMRFCQRYVDRFNGDSDSDPASNGEERLLREQLPKLVDGCVFDVGANIGNWAQYALAIEPSLRLHCFEPSGATFQQLAARAWPATTTLNNIGLGDREGEAQLNVIDEGSGLNSLYVRHGVDGAKVQATESIRISTVDAYSASRDVARIDFLKIDIEGHEFPVLRGCQRMLSEGRIGMIQFEYGGSNLDARVYLRDIWDYLAPFGFDFYKLHHDGIKRIPAYSQALETFKYANFLAKRVGQP